MDQKDLQISTQITHIALANGAQAFSNMIHDKVTLKDFSTNPTELFERPSLSDFSKQVVLMRTDFMGEILCKCYLILDETNTEKVASVFLPEAYQDHKIMRDAAFLEMDNIVSAAVATKYADVFYTDIKGDVPHIAYLEAKDADSRLHYAITRRKNQFYHRVRFVSDEKQISAEFICILTEELKKNIRLIRQDERLITLIKSYTNSLSSHIRLTLA